VDLIACELSLEHCQTSRRYAQEEGVDLPVVQADGERLPFAGDSFDVVLLCDLVEHNPFPGPLLHEAERVCKKDGTLVVGGPWQKHPKANDGLKKLLSGKKHGAPDFPHNTPKLRRLLSRSELVGERYCWFIGWYVALFRPAGKA
jgi:SAM-dependent methyltransferase